MVRSEELAQKPVASVEQALQGKVAGLQVSAASSPPVCPRFMLPIPQIEMLYNKALTAADQNEYWRK